MSNESSELCDVIFLPSGRRGKFKKGTPVLQVARELGVDLDSVCGGRGICTKCMISPTYGVYSKFGISSSESSISPINAVEKAASDRKHLSLPKGARLGCQAKVEGDLVIDVPLDSQVHKQIVRKRAEVRNIIVDPSTRLYFVEVEPPDIDNPEGDLERLKEALYRQWKLAGIIGDLRTLQMLQKALRDGKWKVTVAIYFGQGRSNGRIVNVWPGFYSGSVYGIAFDIGSTTVAAHCCDLRTGEVLSSAGLMNPQIRYGEDLMSRVSYSQMNPGGFTVMTSAVREAMNALIGQVTAEAMLDRHEILEAVVVANPIMHHLFLGIDPVELGVAPFALASSHSMTLWGKEVELDMHPDSRVYILPCIAGHVGADCAAVVLSEQVAHGDTTSLVIDVGTNAEIVLGNKHKIFACSSPTGPAFEGAQISCGQRAANGVIESVRIDPETKLPYFKVIGSEAWSNEEAFLDYTGGISGICGSGIIEVIAEMRMAGILTEDGEIIRPDGVEDSYNYVIEDNRTFSFVLHYEDEVPKVFVSQNDIRAIQLGKAALYAGIKLLMEKAGVESVDRVTLAGAFGAKISPRHAMTLGMIPDCDLNKVSSVGNAAGTGARIALLNASSRRDIELTVEKIEKIETATAPDFQRHFVEAMAIPHKVDKYSVLESVIGKIPDVQVKDRRKRRRR